jgi:hypothetical protein
MHRVPQYDTGEEVSSFDSWLGQETGHNEEFQIRKKA